MSFVERVNQGESLANWLNWLTEPPAVSWSVIMGDLSASGKGKSGPIQMPSERVKEAVLCTACPCLSWVYTYFHVMIEIIATLHKDKIVLS